MNARTTSRLAWCLWALLSGLAGLTLAFMILTHRSAGELGGFVMLLAVGTVGALIASRRSGNPIGWLFLGIAISGFVFTAANTLAIYGIATRPGSVLGAKWLAWVSGWMWVLPFGSLLTFLPLLFPDGHLPSPRWRPFALFVGWFLAAVMAVFAVLPGTYEDPPIRNPLGIEAASSVLKPLGALSYPIVIVLALICLASLVVRYRRAAGETRQQIKWFVYGAAFMVICFLAGGIASAFDLVTLSDGLSTVGFLGVPVGAALAILLYRLYDIDVVINKTVVFGALAAFITAVYVAVVVGIGAAVGSSGKPNVGLSILATAIVAFAFQPVRDRVQRLANRLVYGKRATPYEVLSEFSSRMGGAYATEDLLPRMARILAEGTGAEHASVWVRVGGKLHRDAAWPADGSLGPALEIADGDLPAVPGSSLSLPVHHRGELLGALALTKPAGERLTPTEEKLAADLASQAGLVLRNVRLTEELLDRLRDLQASRQRIVAAQDDERRRLERNIHDGAQQQLVALAIRVRLARQLAGLDPAKADSMLDEVEQQLTTALEDLRDLARGIYPPLLADQGLPAALAAQARKAALPVEVETDGLVRYPQDVEAAVYFCSLEALQNVAKYANASKACIRVSEKDHALVFSVSDDGRGFDPAATLRGSGLQGMGDRLSALGGGLEVTSRPSEGTTVVGRIPLP